MTATNVVSGQNVMVNYAVTDGPPTLDNLGAITEDAATFGLGLDYTVAMPHARSGTLTFTMDGTQTHHRRHY